METIGAGGGGVIVVCWLVVVVVTGGAAQPANIAVPANRTAPIVRRQRESVTVIVLSSQFLPRPYRRICRHGLAGPVMETARRISAASITPRDQRTVVVSVVRFVEVVSPVGEMVVPLEVDPDELVTTPFTLVVFWVLVSVETRGVGMTGVVVVVVVLEEEDCANAPPVIRVTAIVAASKVLII